MRGRAGGPAATLTVRVSYAAAIAAFSMPTFQVVADVTCVLGRGCSQMPRASCGTQLQCSLQDSAFQSSTMSALAVAAYVPHLGRQ